VTSDPLMDKSGVPVHQDQGIKSHEDVIDLLAIVELDQSVGTKQTRPSSNSMKPSTRASHNAKRSPESKE
jgi:hypothetical protein